MIVFYGLLLAAFTVYSYSLIDVNLTLFNNHYWAAFRQQAISLGYFHRNLSSVIYLAAVILFFLFNWYFVKRYKNVNLKWLTILTGGILLFSYPLVSHDLFNYIFDAKIITVYHKLPYFYTAQRFPGDPWLRFLQWTDRTYPYGPTFIWLTAIPSFLAVNKFILNFFFFKLMWMIFYAAGVYALAKMNKKWAVIFATHPLIIIEALVNTHNDLIMVSAAIVGLYLLMEKKQAVWGRLFLLFSAGIKYLTLPFIFFRKNRKVLDLIFGIFLVLMLYLSLTREIQPWYFLSFFAFLPFYTDAMADFNFFSLGLLVSNYFYIKYGVMNEAWQIAQKTTLLFIFFTLNAAYLFWKKYLRQQPSKNLKMALVVSIVLSVVISRFIDLSRTAFFVNDQGRDTLVLYQMLIHHKWTLIGPATSLAANLGNIYFGPYYYYFLMPFIAVSRSPYFLTAIFPALFIVGILLFLMVRQFSYWEKIFFLLLVTASWYLLFYTRFLWNLNLAFLLSFILFDIFLLFEDKIITSAVFSLILGFAAGAIFQIHYGMLFLYAGLPVFFWKRKRNIIFYLLGFVISFFPFVLFDWRHGGVIGKNLISFLSSGHAPINWSLLPLIFAKIFDYYLIPFITGFTQLKIVIGVAVYGGIMFALWRKKSRLSIFMLAIFIIFPLTFVLLARDFDYYLACFAVWFYLGLAMILPKRHHIVYLFLLLFILVNFIRYFSFGENMRGLNAQINMADLIRYYHEKWYSDEAIKGHYPARINTVRIRVFPNQDDVAGIKYILKTRYNLDVGDNGQKYFVCYFAACQYKNNYLVLPTGEKIPDYAYITLYDEKKDVKLYVLR